MKRLMWKALYSDYKSDEPGGKTVIWGIGKWIKLKGKINKKSGVIKNLLSASENIVYALSRHKCELLALVEVSGDSIKSIQKDLEYFKKMRIVKVWEWGKLDNVKVHLKALEYGKSNKKIKEYLKSNTIKMARRYVENKGKDFNLEIGPYQYSIIRNEIEYWSSEIAGRSIISAVKHKYRRKKYSDDKIERMEDRYINETDHWIIDNILKYKIPIWKV